MGYVMGDENSKNNQRNREVDECSSAGFKHFPSSTLLINENDDAVPPGDNKNLDCRSEKISEVRNNNTVEARIISSNDDEIIWRKIAEFNNKRKKIFAKFKEVSRQIKPMEFESYYEFFVLTTFKKGRAASGHIAIEDIMRNKENNTQSYRRSKRNHHDSSMREPVASLGISSFSDEGADDNDNVDNGEIERLSKERDSAGSPMEQIPKRRRNMTSCLMSDKNKTIAITNSRSGERRSTRLLNKANNHGTNPSTPAKEDGTDENYSGSILKELYESIVPKVDEPYRRSDWVLPSRSRFSPDKQMRTKPEYEKINLSDLISVEKIQRVLSRFEGGLKGVRKTNWSSTS